MIKKNIFYCLCIFLLLISKMAFAKEQTDTLESKVIYTDFVMTKFIAQVNRTIESKGNAKISEENGICWKVTSPISKVLHITSNGVIDLTDENALQNQNSNNVMQYLSTSFAQILGKDKLKHNNDFDVTEDKAKRKIFLRPKNKDLAKVIFSINITYKDEFIEDITIVESTNSYTKLQFLNQVFKNVIKEDLNSYCNVEK